MSNERTRIRPDKREMKCADLIQLLDGDHRAKAEAAFNALEERRRIRKLNAVTLDENKTRRDYNRDLWDSLEAQRMAPLTLQWHYKRGAKPMLRHRHRIDKATRMALADLDTHRVATAGDGCQGFKPNKQYAGSKTPEKWSEEIRRIADPIARVSVACIVWWDFFSQRIRDEGQPEWTHLNDLIAEFRDHAPIKQIVNALIDCGYHPFDAAVRVTGGEWHR
jgi:hypothetical protein